jgi:hypothetical protein
MLEENALLSFPTEEDLLDCDEKPVDKELQMLILMRRQAEERLAEAVRSRLVIADQLELERGRFLEIAEQLQQERGLREVLEAQLEQERLQLEVEVRSRLEAELALETAARSREAEQALRLEAEQALVREKETIALNLLQENIPLETIARTTGLTIAQLEEIKGKK